MSEMDDLELRSRFAELRAADEIGAPEFHGVVEGGRLRAPRASRIGWRSPARIAISLATAAAAAAIVLAIGATMQSRQRRVFVPVTLSIWTSPTASLLVTPGSDLISSPTFAPSIVDPKTSTTLSRRGKKK
jgi:hypothetical protein